MKKIALIATVLLFTSLSSFAQQDKTTPPQYEDIFEQMKKMQQEMMKHFGGKMQSDSTESSDEGFGMGFPNMKMDTSFTKSFGMLFDGKEWKSMMPNDSTMNGMMRGFGDKMPNFGGNGMDMSEMFKGIEKMFGDSFGGGFGDDMQITPRPQPKEKKRKGEADKKDKKYKTEDL
jgi:hypothetical protein